MSNLEDHNGDETRILAQGRKPVRRDRRPRPGRDPTRAGGGAGPGCPRPAADLPVPARVWIAAGRELNLWHGHASGSARSTDVTVTVDAPVGSSGERGFRWRPGPEQAGRSFPVTVRVHDGQGLLLASRAFELHVAPARIDSARPLQLLFLGDSLTHGVGPGCRGMISGEAKRLLETEAGVRPLLLGRNDDMGDNRHEGLGGWSFHSFTTPGGEVTRFRVAGVTRKPTVFSAYRCGEVVYRIQSGRWSPRGRPLRGTLLGAVRALDNQGFDPRRPAGAGADRRAGAGGFRGGGRRRDRLCRGRTHRCPPTRSGMRPLQTARAASIRGSTCATTVASAAPTASTTPWSNSGSTTAWGLRCARRTRSAAPAGDDP